MKKTYPLQVPDNTVILDNATLRSALIAFGLLNDETKQNTAKPFKLFDSHIASAEVLIESLFLHDRILIPKLHDVDYPQITALARKHFGDLFVELDLPTEHVKDIENLARRDFGKLRLADKQLRQTLREVVGADSSITSWDKWIFAKYGLFNPDSGYKNDYCWYGYEQQIKDTLVDISNSPGSFANPNWRDELSKQCDFWYSTTDSIVLWLTFRTYVYDILSWITEVPYVPHPHRASIWKEINIRRSNRLSVENIPRDMLFDARIAIGNQINDTLGVGSFDLTIPPFFAYVLAQAKSKNDVFDIAMELRASASVAALRNKMSDLSVTLRAGGKTKEILKMKREFDDLSIGLLREVGAEHLPKVSPSIQIGSVFGISFDIELPSIVSKVSGFIQSRKKPHLAILRDVFKVTSDIWKFSHLYEKLFNQKIAEPTIVKPQAISILRQEPLSLYEPPQDENGKIIDEIVIEPNFISPKDCRNYLESHLSDKPDSTCHVIVLDIDNLDKTNVIQGRKFGDKVLDTISKALEQTSPDFMSKVVGDTFIIVLFEDKKPDEWLLRFATNLKKQSLQSKIESPNFSVGTSTSPVDGRLADELFKLAYTRMAEEKTFKKKT